MRRNASSLEKVPGRQVSKLYVLGTSTSILLHSYEILSSPKLGHPFPPRIPQQHPRAIFLSSRCRTCTAGRPPLLLAGHGAGELFTEKEGQESIV